jgi:peptide deformylase
VRLHICQVGELVLRQAARPLSVDEIRSAAIQELIEYMQETMRAAPGVGLAAPQVGMSLQLAVIEDRPEYVARLPEEVQAARERSPIPFHVIINPQLTVLEVTPIEFFEGCLSLSGFMALVPRACAVRVECLNERAESVVIEARGWYARILQHEIDHLHGRMYIDRMQPRSLMSLENHSRYWEGKDTDELYASLGLPHTN